MGRPLCIEHPAAAGGVFNVTDGKFHTLNEIIESICSALGRKPPRLSLPVGPVRFAAGIVEDLARSLGLQPPITRATIDKYSEDLAWTVGAFKRSLDLCPSMIYRRAGKIPFRKCGG